MQCYKCQCVDHIWVHCKQSPRCGHCHQEYPEKDNSASIVMRCSSGGCSCTKKEQQWRKQGTSSQVSTHCNTASKLSMPGETYTTVAATAEGTKPNSKTAKTMMPVPNKCSTGGDMFMLIATVQHMVRDQQ
jgi:hypothetical protein